MRESIFEQSFISMVREVFQTEEFIPLHAPRFSGREKELVLETLDSTFVSSIGEFVCQFERELTQYTGAGFGVATSSGTAALHTALIVAQVVQNDEVITTPLTFVATCNAITYCGASPVFVDVDHDTLGLCPVALEGFLRECADVGDDGLCRNRLSGKIIRACLPVHNLGHPAKVEQISLICSQYNIALIEDAAESLGSWQNGIHTGRTGRLGVFSFNGNKIITTGGGGALITDDESLALRAKYLTTTAKRSHPWLFQHDEVGFNYRLPNLNAALGCAQLEQLEKFVSAKRWLTLRYEEFFSHWPEVSLFAEPSGARSNYWLNAILLQDREARDRFLDRTNKSGVMTRPMWTPMHTLPMYRDCYRSSLSTAISIEERLVNIPSSAVGLQ